MTHDPVRIGFSGWLASGKDTVAEHAVAALGGRAVRLSYADPIKDELDDVIAALRRGDDDRTVAGTFGVTAGEITGIREAVAGELAADPGLHARMRTDGIRTALQQWGTDVRRKRDMQHWVRASLKVAEAHLAAGRGVYYTDVRFPNEVEALKAAGFLVVRIDVTRATQRKRLEARDGIHADATRLDHPSETALDGYDRFGLRVDNDGDLDDCVRRVVDAYRQHASTGTA